MPQLTQGPERRYAKALFELAEEGKVVAKVKADMEVLQATLVESEELTAFLSNPVLPQSLKTEALAQLAKKAKMQPLSQNFLNFVGEQGRSALLGGMAAWLLDLADEAEGNVKARVTSAKKLTAAQIKDLEAFVKKKNKLAKKVTVEAVVDPAVLAGLKVRVGSEEFDATASGRLARLRSTLKA